MPLSAVTLARNPAAAPASPAGRITSQNGHPACTISMAAL
jgi:hypothetical protein